MIPNVLPLNLPETGLSHCHMVLTTRVPSMSFLLAAARALLSVSVKVVTRLCLRTCQSLDHVLELCPPPPALVGLV